jgi:hypothetical protein
MISMLVMNSVDGTLARRDLRGGEHCPKWPLLVSLWRIEAHEELSIREGVRWISQRLDI